jgi:hypothetical protein
MNTVTNRIIASAEPTPLLSANSATNMVASGVLGRWSLALRAWLGMFTLPLRGLLGLETVLFLPLLVLLTCAMMELQYKSKSETRVPMENTG